MKYKDSCISISEVGKLFHLKLHVFLFFWENSQHIFLLISFGYPLHVSRLTLVPESFVHDFLQDSSFLCLLSLRCALGASLLHIVFLGCVAINIGENLKVS